MENRIIIDRRTILLYLHLNHLEKHPHYAYSSLQHPILSFVVINIVRNAFPQLDVGIVIHHRILIRRHYQLESPDAIIQINLILGFQYQERQLHLRYRYSYDWGYFRIHCCFVGSLNQDVQQRIRQDEDQFQAVPKSSKSKFKETYLSYQRQRQREKYCYYYYCFLIIIIILL